MQRKPKQIRGWISKTPRGNTSFAFIQSLLGMEWKNRFFVLDDGVLTYYADKQHYPPYGKGKKGSIVLNDCQVIDQSNLNKDHRSNQLVIVSNDKLEKKILLLQFNSIDDADLWKNALIEHINYKHSISWANQSDHSFESILNKRVPHFNPYKLSSAELKLIISAIERKNSTKEMPFKSIGNNENYEADTIASVIPVYSLREFWKGNFTIRRKVKVQEVIDCLRER